MLKLFPPVEEQAKYLTKHKITYTPIEKKITNKPEAFQGRNMKTISFEIASALLFKRSYCLSDVEEGKGIKY